VRGLRGARGPGAVRARPQGVARALGAPDARRPATIAAVTSACRGRPRCRGCPPP
jgi:hypothetical protein